MTILANTYSYRIAGWTYLTDSHIQISAYPTDKAMPYCAGQYLLLAYPNGDYLPFSIANAPRTDHQIDLHIRAVANDEATKDFISVIKQNPILAIKGPFGDCCYQPQGDCLVLIAAGTGFAPAKAIIEAAIESSSQQSCYLYWTVKQAGDFYLPELTQKWQDILPNFHFQPIVTQTNTKRNVIEVVLNDFANFSGCQIYVFGPPSLAVDALTAFKKVGLRAENFFTDVLSREEILKRR